MGLDTILHPSQTFVDLKAQNNFLSFSIYLLPLLAGLFRIIIAIVFVGSFLLRPLIMRPVSLVWARIIESDKPVFTLTFGGVAAFASAISEAAKHL